MSTSIAVHVCIILLTVTWTGGMITPQRQAEIDIDLESYKHFQNVVGDRMVSKEFLLCTDDEGNLQCPEGTKIGIRSAFFGQRYHNNVCNQIQLSVAQTSNKTCSMNKAAEVVRQRCQDQRHCRLRASGKQLDPLAWSTCQGLYPYLSVATFCQPDIHIQLLCADAYLEIACTETQILQIIHARITNKYEYKNTKCMDTVKANSGMEWCPDEDMTAPVDNLCKSQKRCNVKATFPPNKGCARTHLLLVYSCIPVKQEKTITDPKIRFKDDTPGGDKEQTELAVNDQGGPVHKNRNPNQLDHQQDKNRNVDSNSSVNDGDPNLIMFAALAVGCGFLFIFLMLGIFVAFRRRRQPEGREPLPETVPLPLQEPAPLRTILPANSYLLNEPVPLNGQLRSVSSRSSSDMQSICSYHSALRSPEPHVTGHSATVRFSQLSDLFVYQPNSHPRQSGQTRVQVQLDNDDLVPAYCSPPQLVRTPSSSPPTVSDVVYTPRGVSYL